MKRFLYTFLFLALSTFLNVLFVSSNSQAWAPVQAFPDIPFSVPQAVDQELSKLSGSEPFKDWRNLTYFFGHDHINPQKYVFSVESLSVPKTWLISEQGQYTVFSVQLIIVFNSDGSVDVSDVRTDGSTGTLYYTTVYSLHLSQAYKDAIPTWDETLPPSYIELNGDIPGGDVDPVACSVWDVACWFKETINRVVTTMQDFFGGIADLFNNLANFFGTLFVPEPDSGESVLTSLLEGFNSSMKSKLGFLTFPFDFAADVFSPMFVYSSGDDKSPIDCRPTENQWHSDVCFLQFEVFGGRGSIDLGAMQRYYEPIFNILIVLVRIAFAFGIAEMFRRAYMEITAK